MADNFRLWRRPTLSAEVIERGVLVAQKPYLLSQQPKKLRKKVEEVAQAVTKAPQMQASAKGKSIRTAPQPIAAMALAQHAAQTLRGTNNVTPSDIELALRRQGMDWAEPFAPGRPLAPYYGHNQKPRNYNYTPSRNVSTDTRPFRIPFATLKQVIESYDIAQTCIRHTISDLRSMPLVWGPIDGNTSDITKDVEEAKAFWKKPDGKRFWNDWLAMWMQDKLRYDAGTLYRQRNKAGKLISLPVIDGTTIAPMRDFFGDIPEPPAPAFQQFIQGIPWDWLNTDDIIYEPMWPLPESPYGVPAIETVLMNANTDMRLQLFFLQFFTEGAVSEMLLEAPPDQSDPDALAEYQETWDAWMDGNQGKRHGARWVPSGAKPFVYKNIDQINPKIAEYVMRRTIAAFQLTPQDLGILDNVNKATGDTQVDSQFRISTLPNTEHYEAIINAVTQDDLGLPVQAHFDTGRESEDRLVEAQAHEIYVSMGAESVDEVRSRILGLKVSTDQPVPRFYESDKLGPVPLAFVIASSGEIDPETLAPKNVKIDNEPFIPAYGRKEDFTPGAQTPGTESGASPGGPRPLKIDEKVQEKKQSAGDDPSKKTPKSTESNPRATKSLDLLKWRKQSKDRVLKGQKPREFKDSAIDAALYDQIWSSLQKAESISDVEHSFMKVNGPSVAGLALRAADTGRVLMLQRATDPIGKWEFPGGHLETGENTSAASLREWEEETGLILPGDVTKVSDWTSLNGIYQGFVLETQTEDNVDFANRNLHSNPDGDEFEAIAWHEPSELSNNPSIRNELASHSQIVQAALTAQNKNLE